MNVIHNIGYTCNNNCIFCGIAKIRERVPDLSTEEIKGKLSNAKEEGADELIFSGGECTIRPDFVELIKFASEKGYNHIEITSNGRMFSYFDYAKKITDAGLGFIRISLHGPNAKIHESITRTEGSFAETLMGIKNLCKIRKQRIEKGEPPIFIEVTCAVNKLNYRHLHEMVDLFNNFDLTHIDMNYVIPWDSAHVYFSRLVPLYSVVVPLIKKELDKNTERNVKITKVANIPLCFLIGYEQYISELFEVRTNIINPRGKPFHYSNHRATKKAKPEKCNSCSYYNLCEGIYTQYLDVYGDSEIEPVAGEKIDESNVKEFFANISKD